MVRIALNVWTVHLVVLLKTLKMVKITTRERPLMTSDIRVGREGPR